MSNSKISMNTHKGGIYDFSDPVHIGPGSWFFMHALGAMCKTRQQALFFCEAVEYYCEIFKCADCKGHCAQYLRENSPRKLVDVPNGVFYWSIQFRNDVQKRIDANKPASKRKPMYDPLIMYDIFHVQEFMVCTEGCGDKDGEKKPETTKTASTHSSSSKKSTSQYVEYRTSPKEAEIIRNRMAGIQRSHNPSSGRIQGSFKR